MSTMENLVRGFMWFYIFTIISYCVYILIKTILWKCEVTFQYFIFHSTRFEISTTIIICAWPLLVCVLLIVGFLILGGQIIDALNARFSCFRRQRQESNNSEIVKKRKGLTAHLIKSLKRLWTDSSDNDCAICLAKLSNEIESFKSSPDMDMVEDSHRLEHLGMRIKHDRDNDVVVTECGHRFHNKCIHTWFENHVTCPLCRVVAGLIDDVERHVCTELCVLEDDRGSKRTSFKLNSRRPSIATCISLPDLRTESILAINVLENGSTITNHNRYDSAENMVTGEPSEVQLDDSNVPTAESESNFAENTVLQVIEQLETVLRQNTESPPAIVSHPDANEINSSFEVEDELESTNIEDNSVNNINDLTSWVETVPNEFINETNENSVQYFEQRNIPQTNRTQAENDNVIAEDYESSEEESDATDSPSEEEEVNN